MPRLPSGINRVDPQVNKPTSEVSTQKINPEAVATGGKMFTAIGQGMEDVGEKLYKAHSFIEETKAKNEFALKLAEIKGRAENDPDYSENNYKKYKEELNRALADTASGISIPGARNVFTLTAQSQAKIADVELRSSFTSKLIKDAKNQFELEADRLQTNYVTSPNLKIKENALVELDTSLKRQIENGFMTEAQAALKRIETKDKWDEAHIAFDIETRADFALQELQKGEKGFYSGVNPIIRQEGIEKAQKQIERNFTIQEKAQKRQEEAFKTAQFNNVVEAGLKLVNGTLDQDDLKMMAVNGEIDAEIAGAMELAMFQPDVLNDKEPQPAANLYIKTVEDLERFNPETASKVFLNALKDYTASSQKLNRTDIALIVKTIDEKRKSPNNPIWASLTGAVKSLGAPKVIADVSAVAFKIFQNTWDFKTDPIPVAQAAVQKAYQAADPRASQFEVGKRYKQGTFVGFNPKTGKLMFEK